MKTVISYGGVRREIRPDAQKRERERETIYFTAFKSLTMVGARAN
jgi:hypothetical protein